MKLSAIIFAAVAPIVSFALIDGVTITNPTSQKWWIEESDVELKWTGKLPDFVVWITNPDQKLLSTRAQISNIEPSYNQGRNFKLMKGVKPGKGYKVELCDGVNFTNIYAVSEEFEVKPVGSPYPTNVPDSTPSASGSGASAAGSGATSATTSGAAAAETSKSAAGAVGVPVGAVAVAGALSYFLL